MGGKCGKLREACLSETDKRYDSNADFGLAVQSDFWERTSGYYKFVGMGYDSYGKPVTNFNATFGGFDVPVTFENVVQLHNFTISDTRMSLDLMQFINPATDSPFAFLGGFAIRYELYGTSTFELDGSMHTFPTQEVSESPGVWQEGPSTKSIVVDENTMYSTTSSPRDDSTFLSTANVTGTGVTKSCIDPNCDKITGIQQYFNDGELRSFLVYQAERLTEDEYISAIENSITDFQLMEALVAPLKEDFGKNYPTEEQWCEVDPACGESPYQEPVSPLRTGPLVGFILLGLAVLFTGFTVFYRTMMARKEKRIRQHFRQRLRQSVAMKSFSVNNSQQFEGMFKRIDAEGTGYIEKKELRDYMNKREPVISTKDFEDLWTSIDTDKSGRVDYLEFCVFMAKCESDMDDV